MKNFLAGALIAVIIVLLIGGHSEKNKRYFRVEEVQVSVKIVIPNELFTEKLRKKVDEVGKIFTQDVQKLVRDHISSGD